MALARWTPMGQLLPLQQELNRMMNEFFWGVNTWVPPVDLYETPDAFVLTAELPGMKHDEIQLEVHDRTLTLRGERKSETEAKDEHYQRRERAYGSFQRVFTLPTPVDADKVQAHFKDGILELRLPKHEAAKPKHIAIQS